MSQENVAVVRGLLAHGATRFALLLSLLAALGLVACDDDDESATTETEVITSDFGQNPGGGGRVVVAGGPNACGDYRRGPGDIVYEIEVVQGVVRCREARRVLKNRYPHYRSTPPWSCVDYGAGEMVQCTQQAGAFRGILGCRVARPTEVRAACPGFELPTRLATPDPPGAELYPPPARKSCGHFRIAPPGDHPLILVEVIFGRLPCRVARRVLKTQYRNGSQDDAIQAALPWRCARAEGQIVCHNYSGPHPKAIRAGFPRE
jgi:hypothetical protein